MEVIHIKHFPRVQTSSAALRIDWKDKLIPHLVGQTENLQESVGESVAREITHLALFLSPDGSWSFLLPHLYCCPGHCSSSHLSVPPRNKREVNL